ncbi:hypothetical protein QTP88_004644 [Uroleucon formosanum]
MQPGRAKRLEQAKEEAQVEIELFRQEREKQFNEFKLKHMRINEYKAAKLDADTTKKIDEINKAVAVNKQAVIDQFLELVTDIKPELPKNFKATAYKE